MLADETPYREYPAEWAINSLAEAGYQVSHARRFPNRYREAWVNGQLDMALRRVAKLSDRRVVRSLSESIRQLRGEAIALTASEGGLRAGADWVIAAVPT